MLIGATHVLNTRIQPDKGKLHPFVNENRKSKPDVNMAPYLTCIAIKFVKNQNSSIYID